MYFFFAGILITADVQNRILFSLKVLFYTHNTVFKLKIGSNHKHYYWKKIKSKITPYAREPAPSSILRVLRNPGHKRGNPRVHPRILTLAAANAPRDHSDLCPAAVVDHQWTAGITLKETS